MIHKGNVILLIIFSYITNFKSIISLNICLSLIFIHIKTCIFTHLVTSWIFWVSGNLMTFCSLSLFLEIILWQKIWPVIEYYIFFKNITCVNSVIFHYSVLYWVVIIPISYYISYFVLPLFLDLSNFLLGVSSYHLQN